MKILKKGQSQHGFALVETLVAMTLIVIGGLALATTLAGGALVNARTSARIQAIAYAEQVIDRMKSMPYEEIGMAPSPLGKDQPAGITINAADTDPGRGAQDWRYTYCPFQNRLGCSDMASQLKNPSNEAIIDEKETDTENKKTNNSPVKDGGHDPTQGRIITLQTNELTGNDRKFYKFNAAKNEPRQSKQILDNNPFNPAQLSSYQKDGLTAYVYVYWPYDSCYRTNVPETDPSARTCSGQVSQNWKMITVVVKYRDRAARGSIKEQKDFTSVQITSAVINNPGLSERQIPQFEVPEGGNRVETEE